MAAQTMTPFGCRKAIQRLAKRSWHAVQSGCRGNKARGYQSHRQGQKFSIVWPGVVTQNGNMDVNSALGAAPSSVRQQRGAFRTDPLKIFLVTAVV